MLRRDITEELSDEESRRGLMRLLSDRYTHFKRAAEITAALSRYGFGRLGDQVGRVRELRQDPDTPDDVQRMTPEVRFRLLLESLGPTFIKLGQMLATRPDLIDDDFAEELGNLRDSVPAEPIGTVRATIEAELGGPVEAFFDDFPERPFAAASIGQVFKARVKGTGDRVAVKVQRADILGTIRADMEILKDMSRLLAKAFSDIERFDPEGVVEEFSIMIVRELDYTLEARNIQRFAANLEGIDGVRVPRLYPGLSTGRVLTMEFIDGVPMDRLDGPEAPKVDRRELVSALSTAFIKQFFVDGFFHADPHHANLLLDREGRVVLIDLGAVGYLDGSTREVVADLYMALMGGDEEAAARALMDVCDVSSGDVHVSRLAHDLRDYMDYLEMRRAGVDVRKGINQRVVSILLRHRLHPPSSYVLLDRALLHIEAVARSIDPGVDFVALARENLGMLAGERLTPRREPLQALMTAREWADFMRAFPDRMERLMDKVERDRVVITAQLPQVEELRSQVRKAALMVSVSFFAVALVVYITWAQEKLQLPVVGIHVTAPIILVAWLVILWVIWRRM